MTVKGLWLARAPREPGPYEGVNSRFAWFGLVYLTPIQHWDLRIEKRAARDCQRTSNTTGVNDDGQASGIRHHHCGPRPDHVRRRAAAAARLSAGWGHDLR